MTLRPSFFPQWIDQFLLLECLQSVKRNHRRERGAMQQALSISSPKRCKRCRIVVVSCIVMNGRVDNGRRVMRVAAVMKVAEVRLSKGGIVLGK